MRSLLLIAVLLIYSASAYAAPSVSGISGTLTDGSNITVSGTSFGANGPTIVVFDNFESGTNGNIINTGAGSATVGQWDNIVGDAGGNQPVYDNTYSISGSQANMGNATVQSGGVGDAGSQLYLNNIDTNYAFVSYWIYMPADSDMPCDVDDCNWKTSWLYGATAADDDQVFSLMLGVGAGHSDPPYNIWYVSCNECFQDIQYTFTFTKGNWYRHTAWVHATNDTSGEREVWWMSPDLPMAVTQVVNQSGIQIFNNPGDMFENFSLNGYMRHCNGEGPDCLKSAPRYDDVYVAKGQYARARVVVGNASTYNASTNLSIATVTSWSDTSVVATLRQGSFAQFPDNYLYVIDSDGTVNANGFLIEAGDPLYAPFLP